MLPESHPYPLGVHLVAGGANVAVLAGHADAVELCLLEPAPPGSGRRWEETRVPLTRRTHDVFHDLVPGIEPGQHYGLRAHGRWEPGRGHRYNPAKLLLDPYARAVQPPAGVGPELFAHTVQADLSGDDFRLDPRDSADLAPVGVVTAPAPDLPDQRPDVPWAQTVVYETHVRGFTRRLPGVPEPLRGTYAGLAHPAALEHLQTLGVTAVELLPVHAACSEFALARRGRSNYWGYSTLGFFAPHAPYSAAGTPQGAVQEFREMVRALHAAGLEVILDVVYNHTCEGGVDGPTLSWRGLDAAGYYRLDSHGRDQDVTGCGNSLDFRRARVVQLTLDSLRYWVQEMHVDGFRFDLAPTLARGRDGFDPEHPFLVAARADPVLATVKLIVEPWDIGPGGWRTGQFPPPFAEWNDRFRNSVRDFWLVGAARAVHHQETGGVRELATRIAGSADTFAPARGPLASVNFVTAHDGFTLADLTTYAGKRNQANGEDNRDGSDDNRNWDHGLDGPTAQDGVNAARRRSMRNLLATLLVSSGVPMLLAGDEFGRSQGGNNNPYCLDDETTWVDWELQPWQQDLLATTRHLLAIRRAHPGLRQDAFFAGRPVHPSGSKDLAWFGSDGAEMDHVRWHDHRLRSLQVHLHAVTAGPDGFHADESVHIAINGDAGPARFSLPGAPWAAGYRLLWDSAQERPPQGAQPLLGPGPAELGPFSMQLYAVTAPR